MDIRKLWDTNTEETSAYKGVCDVYGAEHLARLIGSFLLMVRSIFSSTRADQSLQSRFQTFWLRPTWTNSQCRA